MTAKHNTTATVAAAACPDRPDALDALDGLSECLLKAQALAWRTYGEGGKSLRNMCDDGQDAYMWALSGLIDQARECFNRLLAERELERHQRKGEV